MEHEATGEGGAMVFRFLFFLFCAFYLHTGPRAAAAQDSTTARDSASLYRWLPARFALRPGAPAGASAGRHFSNARRC